MTMSGGQNAGVSVLSPHVHDQRYSPAFPRGGIVERYCWFHGGVSGDTLATSMFFNPDGSLTAVGKAYRAVG